MINKFFCWLKTRHENKIILGLGSEPRDTDGTVRLFKRYKCKNCGYRGKETLRYEYRN